jgi:4,5-DOPA dioxygenase extradiol
MNNPAALPSLFISHGAPTLALADSPTGRFLDALGPALPRPRAILVASAHMNASQPLLTASAAPATLHDFGGFPRELYALRYPAPGAPALAARAATLLQNAGFDAATDAGVPIDHGVWVPLLRMYPAADIPVSALSVSPARDAAWHYALGAALASLREEGVLVIGSGGFVHNLGALDWQAGAVPTVPWASGFADWMERHVVAGEIAAATSWRTQAPQPLSAHPTPEHLLPLFVAWGAAGGRGRRLHAAWELGTLALHAFRFDGAA